MPAAALCRLSGLALKNQKLQTTELLSSEQQSRDDHMYWVFSHLSQVGHGMLLPAQVPRTNAETCMPSPGVSDGSRQKRELQENAERDGLQACAWLARPCLAQGRADVLWCGRNGLSGQPYLYTLSLAAPESSWDVLGPLFQQSADSFRLLPTGRE